MRVCRSTLADSSLHPRLRLPRFVGSVDQLTNLVCVRDWPERRAGLTGVYRVAG